MAFRELHVVEIKEILRLWARGYGYRLVASRTGTDRKTVRRYVEAATKAGFARDPEAAIEDDLISAVVGAVQPGAMPSAGEMREHLRQHAELVRGWVSEGCHGPKLVRLLMRSTGVAVPLRTMQRFVAEDLGVEQGAGDTVRIVDPPPGQVLEVDFLKLGDMLDVESGDSVTLFALLCTAPYSRHQFVWPCLGVGQDDVIEGLDAAWAFFGGVFPVLLPDNQTPIVKAADPVDPVFNESFIEYAQARGFEIDPARARKAKDKARVERQVRYVRDDYFRGERFRSLTEAREAATRWSTDEAGMRKHGRTQRHPLEVFEAEERPLLKPSPTEAYDQPVWSDHTLGRDHAIIVGYALYSVPYQVEEGTPLRARRDRKNVKIYRGAVLVKLHPRQPSGGTSIDPVDLPPGKAELATRDTDTLCKRAERYGPHVGEYARRLAAGPLPWSRMRFVYRLLALGKRYGGAETDEACARALELDVIEVKRIEGMLENGLVRRNLLTPRPPPQPPPDNVYRFARDPAEFRRGGGPDASA